MKNITGGQVDLLFVPELHNISVFHTSTGKRIFLKIKDIFIKLRKDSNIRAVKNEIIASSLVNYKIILYTLYMYMYFF